MNNYLQFNHVKNLNQVTKEFVTSNFDDSAFLQNPARF